MTPLLKIILKKRSDIRKIDRKSQSIFCFAKRIYRSA